MRKRLDCISNGLQLVNGNNSCTNVEISKNRAENNACREGGAFGMQKTRAEPQNNRNL